jgi:hypothetical protein
MKKQKYLITFFVIILSILAPVAIYPCTTFVLRQGNSLVFGRNLDWYSGTGLVMVNTRNLEKVALVSSAKPAKWFSKFGSITFNQIGRELPFGGINESGLVVEHMTLDETEYPPVDNRYAISAFQWIQFQLDNYSTIEEVINSDKFLRIEDNSKIHFLICDRSGNSATIEFLDGKMVCHNGHDLPLRALANSTYEESVSCYKNNSDTRTNPSLTHFCIAAKQTDPDSLSTIDSTVDYAFGTLKMVSQELFTKWSIVYDITNMRIYFKVFETPVIDGERKIFMKQPPYDPVKKIIDFKSFNFDCSGIQKVLDINCDHDNAVNQYFVSYSTGINREFIDKAFTFYKGWGLNIELKPGEMDSLARYPETFKCIENKH